MVQTNQQEQQKMVVILGPTATGKSDLAVQLSKKFNGEVVSADSRQVYRGLDLGTGKITKREMQGVRHHLLNVASPRRRFSAANYLRLTQRAIEDISRRGKLLILCGGTGFYIQTVTENLSFPAVPPNAVLRRQLEKKTTTELFHLLTAQDSLRAARIDSQNRRRLIRAIEITTALGAVPPLAKKESPSDKNILYIGITLPHNELLTRIRARLEKRLRRGLVAEVQRLHASGISWKRLDDFGLEYRYVAEFLQKKLSKQEMIEKLDHAIAQYAKRQMTWFKRNKKIHWLAPNNHQGAEELVKEFLEPVSKK